MANVVDKLPQDEVAEELYNELLQAYMGVHGGKSKQVLEHEIDSLMKKGLGRAEAISKLAEKEGTLKNELLSGLAPKFLLLLGIFLLVGGFIALVIIGSGWAEITRLGLGGELMPIMIMCMVCFISGLLMV